MLAGSLHPAKSRPRYNGLRVIESGTLFVRRDNPMSTADFLDFVMGGGDELLNGHECPHCKEWFHIDDAEEVDGKPDTVICPHCSKKVRI